MRVRSKVATVLFAAVLLAAPVVADTKGEVTSVDGELLVISIRSGTMPALGDTVSVMKAFDGGAHAIPIGTWRVTRVQGTEVQAVRIQSFGNEPQVGMLAHFASSRGEGFREGPDVAVPGAASSGVPGKVAEVRGQEVTIRIGQEVVPVVGDRVELSFAAGEDTISVGTWKITAVRADGQVEAAPVEALAAPTTVMDATVWASGSRADVLFRQAFMVRVTDPARAVEMLVQAAQMGHAEAAEQAGHAYMNGQGVPQDDARAAPLLRQAAEAGRAVSQTTYGVFLTLGRGGLQGDPPAGAVWYRKAAAQGEPQGQANLCVSHLRGEGVKKDEAEAFRLCTLAAAQDNPMALDQLGWMYQQGLGIEKSLDNAFRYYERAAKLGWANGQNNLGIMYENGWGVGRDYQQALNWYRQSADQGYAWAEWNLGRMYQEGLGVPQDESAALDHLRRAARGGHQVAQEKLQKLGQTW